MTQAKCVCVCVWGGGVLIHNPTLLLRASVLIPNHLFLLSPVGMYPGSYPPRSL